MYGIRGVRGWAGESGTLRGVPGCPESVSASLEGRESWAGWKARSQLGVEGEGPWWVLGGLGRARHPGCGEGFAEGSEGERRASDL